MVESVIHKKTKMHLKFRTYTDTAGCKQKREEHFFHA